MYQRPTRTLTYRKTPTNAKTQLLKQCWSVSVKVIVSMCKCICKSEFFIMFKCFESLYVLFEAECACVLCLCMFVSFRVYKSIRLCAILYVSFRVCYCVLSVCHDCHSFCFFLLFYVIVCVCVFVYVFYVIICGYHLVCIYVWVIVCKCVCKFVSKIVCRCE